MNTIIVYATGNPGKIAEMKRQLGGHGFDVRSLAELGCGDVEVEETGTTLGENALLKVNAYVDALAAQEHLAGKRIIVLSDDTGLEIDGLAGEPGIHVRRWRDKHTAMTDEEVIEYALERMQGLEGGARAAQFRCVLAVGMLQENGRTSAPHRFEGTLRGIIREEPEEERLAGFPIASLLYVSEWGMLLGAAERLPAGKKEKYLSHRERAVMEALPFLKSMAS